MIISLLFVLYSVYYILLKDTFLNASISSIIASSHKFARQNHVLVLGLIPIYISLMIFGASILGIYVGSRLQQFFFSKQK